MGRGGTATSLWRYLPTMAVRDVGVSTLGSWWEDGADADPGVGESQGLGTGGGP